MKNKILREKLYIIIFESDTQWGKAFDVGLLIAIVASILTVALESVSSINKVYKSYFNVFEWFLTILFTVEYVLRVWVSPQKNKYIFSFYGLIDLISTLPTYLALVISGAHSLIVLRSFRLLRVFRIFKLGRFVGEASQLRQALKASRPKIIVFITAVSIIVVIMGTLMYIIEGGQNGFTSIPRSIYWAIVTLTTVGYGDIAPVTVTGQTIAALVMILGYAIIAVPTGIVTSELSRVPRKTGAKECKKCHAIENDALANFCRQCGAKFQTKKS